MQGEGERRPNLFVLLFVGALPAGIAGLLLDDFMEEWLFSSKVVAIALVVGGFALLWLERWQEGRVEAGAPVAGRRRADERCGRRSRSACSSASRSCRARAARARRSPAGSFAGMSRTAAAEFSFLVGLPILYGACGLKLFKDWEALTGPMLPAVLVATAVSFVSALVVVVPFVAVLAAAHVPTVRLVSDRRRHRDRRAGLVGLAQRLIATAGGAHGARPRGPPPRERPCPRFARCAPHEGLVLGCERAASSCSFFVVSTIIERHAEHCGRGAVGQAARRPGRT